MLIHDTQNSGLLRYIFPFLSLVLLFICQPSLGASNDGLNLAKNKVDLQVPPGFRVVDEKPESEDEELKHELISNPKAIEPFKLHDHNGAPFTEKRLKGKWSFLVFGYTNCPDICPTTLAEMDDFFALLRGTKLLDKTQVLFVTLDPKRDTDKDLKQYLGYFNSSFIGVSGSVEDLHRFCNPLKILFEYEQLTKEIYGVNHSSAVVLLDPNSRYVARFSVPIYAEQLLSKYKKIIQNLSKS